MTDSDPTPQPAPKTTPRGSKTENKRDRLARALRENLQRRKATGREREDN